MLVLTCVNINLNNIIVVTPCMCCVCVYELGRAETRERKGSERIDGIFLPFILFSPFSALSAPSSSPSKIFSSRSLAMVRIDHLKFLAASLDHVARRIFFQKRENHPRPSTIIASNIFDRHSRSLSNVGPGNDK